MDQFKVLCYKPILVRNSKKDFHYTEDRMSIYVPCGKCPACLKAKAVRWQNRLVIHAKASQFSYFLTLTYAVAPSYGVYKPHFQAFIKRLRKNTGCHLKYYAIGEYGGRSQRPHYHAIMFSDRELDHDQVLFSWGLGHIKLGNVKPPSVRYCTNYHSTPKQDNHPPGKFPGFALISKGIGLNELIANTPSYLNRQYAVVDGRKYYFDRYLRNKWTELTGEVFETNKEFYNEYAEYILSNRLNQYLLDSMDVERRHQKEIRKKKGKF